MFCHAKPRPLYQQKVNVCKAKIYKCVKYMYISWTQFTGANLCEDYGFTNVYTYIRVLQPD